MRHHARGGEGAAACTSRPGQSVACGAGRGACGAGGGACGAGGGACAGSAGPAVGGGRGAAMYRLLVPRLGRGLLRAAGRRCGICWARPRPGPAGGRAPEVEVPPSRVAPHGGGLGLLPLLAGEGREPGGDGRAGTGARAGPGDLRAPSRSARVVLEARCGRRGGGAAGSGRGRR